MTAIQAAILGVLQGLTEFLPVSSSGHLALVELLFGLRVPERDLQGFDIVLHAGSLVALFVCYFAVWKNLAWGVLRRDTKQVSFLFYIVIATLPGALAGYFLEDWFAETFRGQMALGVTFFITALVLLLADWLTDKPHTTHMNTMRAFVIGIAQMCALPAAISRSGMTIAAGQLLGFSRQQALDFSFVIAFPIIGGAVFLTGIHALQGEVHLPEWPILLAGFTASLVSSVAAVWWLRRFIGRFRLSWFVPYLVVISIVSILW